MARLSLAAALAAASCLISGSHAFLAPAGPRMSSSKLGAVAAPAAPTRARKVWKCVCVVEGMGIGCGGRERHNPMT